MPRTVKTVKNEPEMGRKTVIKRPETRYREENGEDPE